METGTMRDRGRPRVAQCGWKYPRVCALRLTTDDDQQLEALQHQYGIRRSALLRRAPRQFLAAETQGVKHKVSEGRRQS